MQIWSAEIKDIEKLYESFKGHLPELEKELGHLLVTDDPNVIMLYSRRCLEVIITDLCECELKRPRKTEPLKGIIDKLNKEEKVPSHIITSMDSLNSLSTFGTHPKEYDPEQVRPVLIFLSTIFKWYLKYKNVGISKPAKKETKEAEISPIEKEYSIQESGILLDYHGQVNSDTFELIISKLKQSKDYEALNKTTGKKVYAIFIECLENISRHSFRNSGDINLSEPYLSVRKQENEVIIIAVNPVSENNKNELVSRLSQINMSDEESLQALYDKRINRELKDDENSAGLGLIIMALKSGNRIKYSFESTDYNYSIFEIQISVADYLVKKLIIEQTVSSPKVIFDCDKNIFEISGESRPNDVVGFYGEILKWSDDFSRYLAKQNIGLESFVFNFNFEYFNSSSAKYILDFCKNLARMRSEGHKIVVKWHYKEDDEDMLDAGKEMSRIAKLPFDYVQIKI
jgi:hypothetical protein